MKWFIRIQNDSKAERLLNDLLHTQLNKFDPAINMAT